ncbi:MAG: hypothetical protein H7144_14570 [Burkholderiales bacterium]|nr:hypothetical protein [Phycisphaerae bacterium]
MRHRSLSDTPLDQQFKVGRAGFILFKAMLKRELQVTHLKALGASGIVAI